MTQTPEVLIVGAGPVGLTLALALTQLGLDVRIIDRAPATKRQPRACVIWSRSLEILAELGVIDRFLEASFQARQAAVYANGRELGALPLGRAPSDYPYPLVIEQHDSERLLAEALLERGVAVEFGAEATNVQIDDQRALVEVRHTDSRRETVESAWVVGCEGTRSLVRERAGIPFEGRPRPNLQALQVNAVPRWSYPSAPGQLYFFLAPQVSLGVYPIPVGGYRFFAFTSDPDPSQKEPPSLEQMRTLIAAVARAPDLELSLTEPIWLNRARFQDRVAATFRSGRALLAGDAAHAWAPVGGHGMNAGLRGAHNLAWKLGAVQRGEAGLALLDSYTYEQRSTAFAVMREMQFNILELPLPTWGVLALQALLPIGLRSAAVQERVDLALSDLAMHHRTSPLSWHRSAGARVRAGDRVPACVVRINDVAIPLHCLLGLDHWTLLLLGSSNTSDIGAQLRALVGRYRSRIKVIAARLDGEAKRHPLVESALILVRPDQHIGLISDHLDLKLLRTYLSHFLRD